MFGFEYKVSNFKFIAYDVFFSERNRFGSKPYDIFIVRDPFLIVRTPKKKKTVKTPRKDGYFVTSHFLNTPLKLSK